MTTVAWDGHSLAADSQYNCGGFINEFEKIHEIGDGVFVGVSGLLTEHVPFIKWLRDGKSGDPAANLTEMSALVVYPDKVEFYCGNKMPVELPRDRKIAIGSGQAIATTAMLLGQPAKAAVEIAIQLDADTGGPIKVVTPD